MIRVDLCDRQSRYPLDGAALRQAVRVVLTGEQVSSADISLAVVDNEEMQRLNRRYLRHDYPTDVLSFVLSRSEEALEGEIVVSAEMAAQQAAQFGWHLGQEMLLYVIHGALHLVGYRDTTKSQQRSMREREQHYLRMLGYETSCEDGGIRMASPPLT